MTSIALPFRIVNGRVLTATDPSKVVEQKILDVLLTSNNERVMNPRYGSDLYSMLFEIMDSNVLADFKVETMMDLREHVDSAEIVDIQFQETNLLGSSEYNTTLQVTVVYRIPPGNTNSVTFSVSS
jgi:phage baseplate assembly protein W